MSALRPPVALREGGFTLLELLIVVGIIATLLLLMAPAFTLGTQLEEVVE